jgi:hypothetical protein
VIANHLGGIAGNYDGLITTGGGSLGQGVIERVLPATRTSGLGNSPRVALNREPNPAARMTV